MHCDACVRRVTQALGNVPGVRVHKVEVGKADVLAEPSCEAPIRAALDNAGFALTNMHGAG